MSARSPSLATTIYRQAARVAARMLATSPAVESVLLFRSSATGEVSFGRSDIDLMVVLSQAEAGAGDKLAALYRRVRLLRRLNPAMGHIAVSDPMGIERLAAIESYWNSLEWRGAMLLRGKPVPIPRRPVHPRHAVGYLGPLVDVFFSTVLQMRSRRHLRKITLDIWNAYATASGLIPEPYLRRGDMEDRLRALESGVSVDRFEEPQYATDYVFTLIERLHRSTLSPLSPLSAPLIFEALTPPQAIERTVVVLPGPGSPLPPEAFRKGSFLCTPESLDLYIHHTNAFFYWTLPRQILDLGIKPPTVSEFLFSCRRYGESRFLRHPGFVIPFQHAAVAIVASIRHSLDWLSRGEIPPALARQEFQNIVAAVPSSLAYYRTAYSQVYRESEHLREAIEGITPASAASDS